MVSRRKFLKYGGAAVFSPALLQGCSGNLLDMVSDKISDSAWNELALKLRQGGDKGTVVLPRNPSYSSLALPRNISYAHIRPQGVAVCTSTRNVQEAINWSVQHGISPVPRSPSAHSYAGYSMTNGLSLDLSSMRQVTQLDEERVKIGAGARLGDAFNKMAQFGRLLPIGRCATVGVSGLTLAGGFGFNARKYGMTCDSLVETEIVTADGEVLVCNENKYADLFWACRGGNGGTFGVNTSFTFLTQKGQRSVNVFRLHWTYHLNESDTILTLWRALQNIAAAAPNEFSLRIGLDCNAKQEIEIEALGQFYGSASDIEEILSPALALKPQSTFLRALDFASAGRYLGSLGAPNAFYTKSGFIESDFTDDVMSEVIKWMKTLPAESSGGALTMFRWGGAIGNIDPKATAFIHRNAQYVVEGTVKWRPGEKTHHITAAKEWLKEGFNNRINKALNGFAFQNFIDRNQPNWQHAYYGENFQRLVEVKAKYDPLDLFKNKQSIPTNA